MNLPSIHPLSDKICINCGNSFVAGVLLSKTISPYCDNCSPQATHHCPGCEAAARERDGLKDELTNLRIEIDRMVASPLICGCGDEIGYAEEIGLSQDGAVCGNCATSRKDYDARTELDSLRAIRDKQREREQPYIEQWREAHGEPTTLPDYGRFVDWLMAKLDTAQRAAEDAYESQSSMHDRLRRVIDGDKERERAFTILNNEAVDIQSVLSGLPAETKIGKTIEELCASRREANRLYSGINALAGECEDGNLIDCRLSDHMQELCNCKEVAGKLRALLAETEAQK